MNYYYSRWVMYVIKVRLNSIKIEDEVEIRVELGKKFVREKICLSWRFNNFLCLAEGVDGLVLKLMIT